VATAQIHTKHEIARNGRKRAVQIAKLIDARTMDIRRRASCAQYELLYTMSFVKGLIIDPIYT
jgi:hypothetical protein